MCIKSFGSWMLKMVFLYLGSGFMQKLPHVCLLGVTEFSKHSFILPEEAACCCRFTLINTNNVDTYPLQGQRMVVSIYERVGLS